jgi:molybdate transport repressor ModE-like protein/molybdopterin-binding protein
MWPGIRRGARVRVSIRPEDVVLCDGHPGRTSARNVLPGHVRSMTLVREGAEVGLDVGFPLAALLTRRGAKELGLRRGSAIYALVKATAVVPDPPLRVRIRVALQGARGLVNVSRMDLLRAVDREGSLSKGAKRLGITYRTAWLWAREMNRAWGKPLLDQAHGGKGGGGTTLTTEGRAALREAAQIEALHA